MVENKTKYVRSFLKWPGNKHKILGRILPHLKGDYKLIDPFLGSASIFLNTSYKRYLLADKNSDLIYLYQTLQKEGEMFIQLCKQLFVPENNNADCYYRLRNEFNNSRNSTRKASIFLYMNRFGFNGMVRYSKKSGYNVPFGLYDRPYFPETEMHYFYKKSKNAVFISEDFEKTLSRVRAGSDLYLDPPYFKSFAGYTENGFSIQDQERLATKAKQLAKKGVVVVLSNHDTEYTRGIYEGAKINSFPVQRNISCDGNNRKKAQELLAVWA